MNSVIKQSKNLQSLLKLRLLAAKVSQLSMRTGALLKASNASAAAEGLIAVGLCKQAKEQIDSACKNIGLSPEIFTKLATSNQAQIEIRLREASDGVSNLIQQSLKVPRAAITPGVEGFIDEILVIAAIVTSRAEEHVKKGEGSIRPTI